MTLFGSVFTKEVDGDIPEPAQLFTSNHEGSLVDIDVDPEVTAAKLKSLKSNKASGDDNISSQLLTNVASEIASPIALVFRKSLDTGCVPHDWRTANVTPLFKKGSEIESRKLPTS